MNLAWNRPAFWQSRPDGSAPIDQPDDAEAKVAAPSVDSQPRPASEPAFGLVDVIEAFTAMRHEWRVQTRETRELAQLISESAARIARQEAEQAARQDAQREQYQNEAVRQLVEAVVDIDLHLSRAIQVAIKYDTERQDTAASALRSTINGWFGGLHPLARWTCGRLHEQLLAAVNDVQATARSQTTSNPTHEGLELVLSRLRRLMHDQRIERVETLGQPFNGESMRAVDVVQGTHHASAHVVEQLSPGYRWQGRLIRYAEVRVAK